MAEQREGQKNEGKVVFEMDMHCEGCAQKIKKVVRNLDGVKDVKADSSTNKLTVTGKVDAAKIKQKLEEKTNNKVEILTPLAQPKKEVHVHVTASGTEQKSDAKPEQKKTKAPKESTVVVKIRLHCDGMKKKVIMKIKGVESVSVEESNDHKKGTMDVYNLAAPYGGPKMELNKMEYYGGRYSQAGPSSYWYDGHVYGQNHVMDHGGYQQQGYVAQTQGGEYAYQYHDHPPPVHEQRGYSYAPIMDYNNPHPPQMFSDENPNACSIM